MRCFRAEGLGAAMGYVATPGTFEATALGATAVAIMAFGAIGLSAWVGWLDPVLFALLALFLVLTAIGLARRRRARSAGANTGDG